ncbi:unnamed protein product [Symbiodinium natans]|uniref:WD domain, G-beta repeat-containing protein n=1 Tax=Symbiodinium natans TaxID=878477 RepID=A0A812N9Y1_9DINO|nr:unnamed protein product [Symbiodinium natans]
MGAGNSAPKPLATSFGEEAPGRRGPSLGSVLLEGPEANRYRLLLVTPLRIQLFDGHDAKPVELEESVAAAVRSHSPLTSFASSASGASEASGSGRMAIGCQDGAVLVFNLEVGTVRGPLHNFQIEEDGPARDASSADLSRSVTALHLHEGLLFAGSCGRCTCWALADSELQREFHLPGSEEQPATASSLVVVPQESVRQLWVGLDNGLLVVFDVETGMLVRSFSCCGPEMVSALAFCEKTSAVFALSAHKRVSIWDSKSFACLQKYPAELMTCGADLSAMGAFDVPKLSLSLLVLAGVDGSLCLRRITRRTDSKLNCILLWYRGDAGGELGCPVTALNFHEGTETVLLGDAGCRVQLQNIREHVTSAAELMQPSLVKRTEGSEESLGGLVSATQGTTEPSPSHSDGPPLPPPADSPPEVSPASAGAPEEGKAEEPPQDPSDEKPQTRDGYPGETTNSAAFPVFNG